MQRIKNKALSENPANELSNAKPTNTLKTGQQRIQNKFAPKSVATKKIFYDFSILNESFNDGNIFRTKKKQSLTSSNFKNARTINRTFPKSYRHFSNIRSVQIGDIQSNFSPNDGNTIDNHLELSVEVADLTLSSRPHNIALNDTLSAFNSTEMPTIIRIENAANDLRHMSEKSSRNDVSLAVQTRHSIPSREQSKNGKPNCENQILNDVSPLNLSTKYVTSNTNEALTSSDDTISAIGSLELSIDLVTAEALRQPRPSNSIKSNVST